MDDQLKEDEMGGAYNIHENRNVYKILVGKLGQNNKRVTLTQILKK
jgi:hypothetical protein